MDNKNRELLESVIEERLTRVRIAEPGNEEDAQAFEEAMAALDKAIELYRLEASHDEQIEKLKIENERLKVENEKNLRDEAAKKKEAKNDRIVQVVTFGAGLVLGPTIDYFFKSGFARYICEFEKDYNFITTPGKSLSSIFRFNKK